MNLYDAYRDGEQIALRRSAVLFLDLLGTVALGSTDAVHAQLEATQEALEHARDWGDSDPADTTAVVRWFSDNLGMAYPVSDVWHEEDALGSIIIAASQHQLALIDRGFIARGAISLDLFYADDLLIYGPALNRAVELEKSRAIYPRVVVDEAATEAARRHLIEYYGGGSQAPNRSLLAVDQDDVTFVHYLGGGLVFDEEQAPLSISYLEQHRDFIQRRLAEFEGQDRIHDKYRWLAAYHDWFIDGFAGTQLEPDLRDLYIEATPALPVSFKPFAHDVPIPPDPWA